MASGQDLPKIPELLAPAGGFEKLVTAVHYGADAVYLAADRYSLRAHAGFAPEELPEAIRYARERGVRAYAAVNIFAHDRDLDGLPAYLRSLRDWGVDGLIVADPGVLAMARDTVPGVPLHLSTQANVTNAAAAAFWQSQGVARLNPARELSLAELATMARKLSARGNRPELEVFVHGAVCISYSGRCLLSYHLTGRHANRGDCAHPCRYRYALVEEKRPGQYLPVHEDGRGTYILNARDLCLLSRLPELLAVGVDGLKIEGRMKSVYYVGGVVRVYRAGLDFLADRLREGVPLPEIELPPVFDREIRKIGTRGLSEHFAGGRPGGPEMLPHAARLSQEYVPCGIVRKASAGRLEVEVRNPLAVGDRVEFLGAGLESAGAEVKAIWSMEGEPLDRAHPGSRVCLATEPADGGSCYPPNTLLRTKRPQAPHLHTIAPGRIPGV